MDEDHTDEEKKTSAFRAFWQRHGSTFGAILLASIVGLFFLFQILFMIEESEYSLRQVETPPAMAQFAIGDEDFANADPSTKQAVYNVVYTELSQSLQREAFYEKINRRYTTISALTEWLIILFLLFLAIWQARDNASEQAAPSSRTVFDKMLPFLAALAIAVPSANGKLGYDARQQLHDFKAQQIHFILLELEMGKQDPIEAWHSYLALYRQSPTSIANFPYD
ncbi:MAG: hypothetical protein AAF697_02475 [Pseudomonadota bacterium]